jgi:hypothetical protein
MVAFLVLLLAVLSRVLPHAFQSVGWNFTAVGGSLLFFGSQMGGQMNPSRPGSEPVSAWRPALKLASAVAILMATDYYLTVYAYQYPFHIRGYIVTWAWYALVCLLGMGLLRKASVLRVVHTLAGLEACYVAAIPFYRNDLVSTAITAGALFGLPVLAAKIVDALHVAQDNNLPTA